jgi:hypothetical protein
LRRCPNEKSVLAILLTFVLVCGISDIFPSAIARADPSLPEIDPQVCQAQLQAVESILSEIDRHNAQPHDFIVPRQQAQLNTYNAEATDLNARKDQASANSGNCAQVAKELAAGGSIPRPKPATVDKINAGKNRLPPGYVPPAPPPLNRLGGVAITNELRPV